MDDPRRNSATHKTQCLSPPQNIGSHHESGRLTHPGCCDVLSIKWGERIFVGCRSVSMCIVKLPSGDEGRGEQAGWGCDDCDSNQQQNAS
jgi:hypothetical protein